jgi:hypothetical protein
VRYGALKRAIPSITRKILVQSLQTSSSCVDADWTVNPIQSWESAQSRSAAA